MVAFLNPYFRNLWNIIKNNESRVQPFGATQRTVSAEDEDPQ